MRDLEDKTMYLVVSTDNQGSKCSTEMCIEESEWNDLTEMAQQELIREHLPDITDIFGWK